MVKPKTHLLQTVGILRLLYAQLQHVHNPSVDVQTIIRDRIRSHNVPNVAIAVLKLDGVTELPGEDLGQFQGSREGARGPGPVVLRGFDRVNLQQRGNKAPLPVFSPQLTIFNTHKHLELQSYQK